MRSPILFALALAALAEPAAAACVPRPQPPLAETLADVSRLQVAWEAFKARHVTEDGRVVDGANGGISHSEGQGYAMLVAAKVGDRETFDRIWAWTTQNLAVREDRLFAWKWSPESRTVTDRNNATDGDIFIVWALTVAGDLWEEPAYWEASRAIARDIGRLAIHPSPAGPVLLPGVEGFGPEDQPDGPVVNLSYYVFPALPALEMAEPAVDWTGLFQAGRELLRTRGAALPPEWGAIADRVLVPADGFTPVFGYNAIRVPLYLAWAGCDRASLAPYRAAWGDQGEMPAVVDLATGVAVEPLPEVGYGAIATLIACAGAEPEAPAPAVPVTAAAQNYYPEILNLLAKLAQLETYPWCVD